MEGLVDASNHRSEYEMRKHDRRITLLAEPWREGIEAIEVDIVKSKPVKTTDDDGPERTTRRQQKRQEQTEDNRQHPVQQNRDRHHPGVERIRRR